ncbi:uncharacterized protein METZ01_LOCUS474753 [marine metagenome]|uniref:Uncharacterized protein n=1 Tax=marine metagenome TaxID=408172 RepID=A0A383BPU6_9ZZZZ
MGFKRYDGFYGSVPQGFINNNFKKCPMCGSGEPNWHLDTQKRWTENRYLFKCQQCEAIISSPFGDVMGFSRTIITTPGLLKRLSGKKTKVIYLKVDEVGSMQTTQLNKDKEFTLDELVEMSAGYGDTV